MGVEIDEGAVPLKPEVRGACEMLGLDPLYVACEGRLMAAVPADEADHALAALRSHPLGRESAIVGAVVGHHPGYVTIRSVVGGERVRGERGHEFYEEIGRKGGQKVRDLINAGKRK